MEAVLKDSSLPSIEQFEESLRNGIYFAKLAKVFDTSLSGRKIFEVKKVVKLLSLKINTYVDRKPAN